MISPDHRRVFSPEDQKWFADFACDLNPIHIAPQSAGASHTGEAVVHGMHVVLWVLNQIAGLTKQNHVLAELDVRFIKPCIVGVEVSAIIETQDRQNFSARVCCGDRSLVELEMKTNEQTALIAGSSAREEHIVLREAKALTIDAMVNAVGSVAIPVEIDAGQKRFPRLAAQFGEAVAPLCGALSQLVGMHCPGLYSLFSAVSLSIDATNVPLPDQLAYRVDMADDRFKLVMIDVECGRVTGSVRAFWRDPFVAQPDIASISNLIDNDIFRGKRVLVVGGSRGIGEATAKLIAAGGGEVTITYHSSEADAERIAAEIRNFGGTCRTVRYDVLRPSPLPKTLDAAFYFATPRISSSRSKIFERSRFETFNRYYVNGFVELCDQFNSATDKVVSVFYPSTIFLDEPTPDFLEYVMAKAAGEEFCRTSEQVLANVRIVCKRLPRIRTDQTHSFVPLEYEEASDVMLPIVKEVIVGAAS